MIVIVASRLFLLIMVPQKFTPQQALPKIKQFCAYQERCHMEVKDKLYGYGLHKNDVEDILVKLIEDNYLNEERFAVSFAGGKFRIKQWGRVKIKYELKQKQVSEYCIKKGLASIDEDAYLKTLEKLFELQMRKLKGEKNHFTRKRKLADHLRMKGYENDLVIQLVNKKN